MMQKNSPLRMKPYPLLTAVGRIHSTMSGRVAHDQGAGVLVVTHDHRAP
jgi:hypothetical protein